MADQLSSTNQTPQTYSDHEEQHSNLQLQTQSANLPADQVEAYRLNYSQNQILNQPLQAQEFMIPQQPITNSMISPQFQPNISTQYVQSNDMPINMDSEFHNQQLYPNIDLPHFAPSMSSLQGIDRQLDLLTINQHQMSENVMPSQEIKKQDFVDDPSIAAGMFNNYLTPTKDGPRFQNSIYENQNEYFMEHSNNLQDQIKNSQNMANLIPIDMKQKIPQTDKIWSNQRKISESHEIRSNKRIYLDEQKNQLSEVQDPPDDHSDNEEKLMIGNLFEEDDFTNSELQSKNNIENLQKGNSMGDETSDFIYQRQKIEQKRPSSEVVLKSREFENNTFQIGQNDQQFQEQQNHEIYNLNNQKHTSPPQFTNIRSHNDQYINSGQLQNPQYINQTNYQHQYQMDQRFPNQPSQIRQQYFQQNRMVQEQHQQFQVEGFNDKALYNLQHDKELIMKRLRGNQQQQFYLNQQPVPSNVNVELPQQVNIPGQGYNEASMTQGFVSQGQRFNPHMPRNQMQYQQSNLTNDEYQALLQQNKILKEENKDYKQKLQQTQQTYFDHFKQGVGIKAFEMNEVNQDPRFTPKYSNQIQPGQQNTKQLPQSIQQKNKNKRKTKKATTSDKGCQDRKREQFQSYHTEYFNNQNDYINEDHQRGQLMNSFEGEKTYTQIDSNDTKPGTRSGGSKSNKLPNYNQNYDFYQKRSNDGSHQDYQGSSQRGGSGGRSGGHHGSYSHGSGQSFEIWFHQIQADINKVNDDPDKEFEILDGHILDLATRKVGSRFLQEHLQKSKQSLINKIIEQIDGHLPDLMTDNYGNYFCSALIRYLQPHNRYHFLQQIKGQRFVDISCNNRGTWALQTIIEAVTQDEEYEIIQENLLENDNIVKLATNKEGEHMIEKIITTFPEDRRQYIFDVICLNFELLAQDKQGLCVMKKLIEFTKNKDSQKQIVNKIIENSLLYVQNEFGNFVVSEVLQQFEYNISKDIFDKMKGNFVKLSQNKYSSKFIEICIDKAPVSVQHEIFEEFCQSPNLHRVVQSNFGNYVLQKSLNDFSKTDEQKVKLLRAIMMCLMEVNEYKVQQKWGNDLLRTFIQNLSNDNDEKEELEGLLSEEMSKINYKNKVHKSNLMNQMSHSSDNYQTYYQKSSNSQDRHSSGSAHSSYGEYNYKKGQQAQQAGKAQMNYNDDQYQENYNYGQKSKKNAKQNQKSNVKNQVKPLKLKKDDVQFHASNTK